VTGDLRERVEAVLREVMDPSPEADQDWHDDPVGCTVDAVRAALGDTTEKGNES
jgi:hypothetical protein